MLDPSAPLWWLYCAFHITPGFFLHSTFTQSIYFDSRILGFLFFSLFYPVQASSDRWLLKQAVLDGTPPPVVFVSSIQFCWYLRQYYEQYSQGKPRSWEEGGGSLEPYVIDLCRIVGERGVQIGCGWSYPVEDTLRTHGLSYFRPDWNRRGTKWDLSVKKSHAKDVSSVHYRLISS